MKNTIQDIIRTSDQSQRKSWIKKTEDKVKTVIDGQLKGIIQELFEGTLPQVFEIVKKETPIQLQKLSDSMKRTDQPNLEQSFLESLMTPVLQRAEWQIPSQFANTALGQLAGTIADTKL